jgi:predicted nicotinamide N-methyase
MPDQREHREHSEHRERREHRERLSTTTGEFDLQEYRLHVAGREWSILHSGALVGWVDEQIFLGEFRDLLPYGVALWPSAIALAHDIGGRGADVSGKTVLELGAGTGLPGIVAASLGARLTQTDKHPVAMHICKRNGERNHVETIQYRSDDWAAWGDSARYDWIIGADILYADDMHDHLLRIFERNLAPGGRVLISDPFRYRSIHMLEVLEAEGWKLAMTKWAIEHRKETRRVGVFELTPPRAGAGRPKSPGEK